MNVFTAEVVGTAILVLLGDGVVAGVLLNHSKAQNGGWIVVTFGWGIAVATAVFAVAQFSGAHINPAVTIGAASIEAPLCPGNEGAICGWGDVPVYLAGEFVGAFLGAVLVYLAYMPHWQETQDPGLKLGVFSTGPAIRKFGLNVVTEIIGTAMLVLGVLAIVSDAGALDSGLAPLLIGLLVFGIGLSLGGPTGYAINPARDLGPRIAHAVLPIAGKGDSDWEYAWVPVVGPIVGGVIGALLYNALWP